MARRQLLARRSPLRRGAAPVLTALGVAAVLLTGCSLTGCSATDAAFAPAGVAAASPSADAVGALTARLEAVPGVATVEASAGDVLEASGPSTPSATVTVNADASADQILAAAPAIISVATEEGWPGTVSLTRDRPVAVDPATDMPSAPGWAITVYPADESDPVADTLSGLLEVEAMPGVESVAYVENWPYVTIADEGGFGDLFDRIRTVPLYSTGATYRLSGDDKHLRVVFVPERTSADFAHEIISIAAAHPSAEVLLEATTYEPQWPELYIAHLSHEDAHAVQAELRDPRWAVADIDGYALPFVLTTTTSTGPQYLTGNAGGLPDDAG